MSPDPREPAGPQNEDAAAVAADLEEKTVPQLEREAARRGVKPASGTGADGGVVKEDLVEAIAADEVAPEDTSGRPPAVQVAEERAANVIEIPAIAPREEA